MHKVIPALIPLGVKTAFASTDAVALDEVEDEAAAEAEATAADVVIETLDEEAE